MKLSLHYVLYDFRFSSSWKRHFSWKHNIENYPHWPDINFLIIVLQKYFWCNIIRRATHSNHMSQPAKVFRQTKIYHFNACQVILLIKHEIFWFNISMWNLSLMQILERRKNLLHNIGCNLFGKILFVNNKLEKLSSIAIFKN
jgi:hypothetical protein